LNISDRFTSVYCILNFMNCVNIEFRDFELVNLFGSLNKVRFFISIYCKTVHKDIPGVILEKRSSGNGTDLTLHAISWAINKIQNLKGNVGHFTSDF